MATVNLSWIFCRTSVSASLETNEMAVEYEQRKSARSRTLTQTLGTETTGSADSVEVRVGVGRSVVVDDDVDSLDVDTSAEDVSGDENTLLKGLELLESRNTDRSVVGPGYFDE